MSDDGRKRPPRFPRPADVDLDLEEIYVPPAPDTERSGPKRLPSEPPSPFKLLTPPNSALRDLVTEVRAVGKRQGQMALQLDGFGQLMNQRFDVFHEELAMLRQLVTTDHAPRIEKVEDTLGQKMAKGGSVGAIIVVLLPLLSDVLPKWASVFERIGDFLQ